MRHTPSPADPGRFPNSDPVPDIQPVEGWQLCSIVCQDGDGFDYDEFIARGPDRDVMLDVSRFRFTPTQDRFDWLVLNGFLPRPTTGPWDNYDIDFALAATSRAVAA